MSGMVASEEGNLPATIYLHNPAIAYDLWVLWRATERRFLPSQLLAEPSGLLDDLLQLDALYNTINKDLTSGDN